jgi:hypothetical protein
MMHVANTISDLLTMSGLQREASGIFSIPPWARRLKIDVGMSENAPHSEWWLSDDPYLCVLGFEPASKARERIQSYSSEYQVKLIPERIGKSLFLIPLALGNYPYGLYNSELFITRSLGCCSFLEPTSLESDLQVIGKETVLASSLDFVLSHINLQTTRYGVIDHLKTDCQGYDFMVMQGAKRSLESICVVTKESETGQYQGSTLNSIKKSIEFFGDFGFDLLTDDLIRKCKIDSKKFDVQDPTFINRRFIQYIQTCPCRFVQNG